MASRYGKEYPFAKEWASVSTICGQLEKPFLYAWYGKLGWAEASRINKNSKLIGALIDQEVCHYFGEEPNEDGKTIQEARKLVKECKESNEYYLSAIHNFHVFAETYNPISVFGQKVVYSETHKYIGTFDRLVVINDKLVLIDWKATNSVSYEYKMQLEAYYRALTEMLLSGKLILEDQYKKVWDEKQLWIVQVPKKEKINLEKNVIQFEKSDKRFNNFISLLNFYYGKREEEKIQKGETNNDE